MEFLNEMDNVIHGITSKNAFSTREVLQISDKEPYSQENPMEYYIATALDEIIKFTTSIIRWEDDFKDGFNEEIEKTLVGNLIIQGLDNEINLYYRKFIEAFINLLLWKEISDDNYVKYYYLVEAFNEINYKIRDLKDFYEISSITQDNQLRDIEDRLLDMFNDIDEEKCFFLKKGRKKIIRETQMNLSKSSHRMKLKKALKQANDIDKLLLGFSYDRYSYASTKVHFNSEVTTQSSQMMIATLRFTLLLANRLVNLSAEILGISDLDEYNSINTLFEQLENTTGWFTPITKDIYDIDDYVYSFEGNIGRIIESITSKYGYKSYRIRFLEDNEIIEDYYPAHEFKRIQPKDKLLEKVFNSQPLLKKIYNEETDKERVRDSLDNSMVVLWNQVLKKRILGID